VAAGLLVASAAACDGGDLEPPGPVLLVGDSIFFGAAGELTWVLAADGWEVTVDARPGSGIGGGGYDGVVWPSRLRDLVAYVRPQVVVVELGTNGCGNCDSVPDAIAAAMEELEDVDSVLWLRVATTGPRAAQGHQINAALEQAAQRWDNLELLPYDEWMAGRTDLVPADDVHPTPAGQQALATHVGEELKARAGSAGAAGDDTDRAVGALAIVALAVAALRGRKGG
jgi:hypothetical protein